MLSVEEVIFPRVMLHAKLLGFEHPESHKEMKFTAPLPRDMKNVVNDLRDRSGMSQSQR